MVKCSICEYESDNIEEHIIKQHNISISDYRIKYPSRKIKDFLYKRICKNCNIEFFNIQNQGNFCSKLCKREYHKKINLKNKNVELVVCSICGYEREDLSQHIRSKHNISVGEYKEKYPDVSIKNKRLLDLHSKQMTKNNLNRVPWNKNIPCSEETKIKIGNSNRGRKRAKRYIKICPNCGKELILLKNQINRIFCSLDCFHNYVKSIRFKRTEKYRNILKKLSISNSNNNISRVSEKEKEIKIFLESKNIKFIHNKGNTDIFGRPDFSFPDKNKIIEFNGCYWHNHTCQNRNIKDKRILDTITSYKRKIEDYKKHSFQILEIWECEWKNNREEQEKRILEFLK